MKLVINVKPERGAWHWDVIDLDQKRAYSYGMNPHFGVASTRWGAIWGARRRARWMKRVADTTVERIEVKP